MDASLWCPWAAVPATTIIAAIIISQCTSERVAPMATAQQILHVVLHQRVCVVNTAVFKRITLIIAALITPLSSSLRWREQRYPAAIIEGRQLFAKGHSPQKCCSPCSRHRETAS